MSVISFYMTSQREIGMPWWQRVKYLPFIMALGIGMCMSQAKAVIEGLVGHESEFTRTPKLGVQGREPELALKQYRALKTRAAAPRAGASAAYLTSAIWFALDKLVYFSLPFLLLFQSGFFYVGLMSLFQGRFAALWRWLRPPAEGAAPALE